MVVGLHEAESVERFQTDVYYAFFISPHRKIKKLVNHGDLPAKIAGLSTDRLTFPLNWFPPSPTKSDRHWLFGLNISFATVGSYELDRPSSCIDPLPS